MENFINHEIDVIGRVTIKRCKKIIFILLRNENKTLQIVFPNTIDSKVYEVASNVSIESIVKCHGKLVSAKVKGATYTDFELLADNIEVLSEASSVPYPLIDSKVGLDVKLQYRYYDLRSEVNHKIFKVQSLICRHFRNYLDDNDFMEIHSPKLISDGGSEGGAEVFKLDYFNKKASLAQSPQLFKQMAINADFNRVYEIGPVFRAENALTHRHLCEFTGLDMEMTINETMDIMIHAWDTIVYIFKELDNYTKQNTLLYEKPLIITFVDCVKLLQNSGFTQDLLEDLSTVNEKELGNIIKQLYDSDLFIIYKYPSKVRPFYTMICENDSNYSESFDIIFKGVEISSGAQRETNHIRLKEKIKQCGINMDSECTLSKYVESFTYGVYKHGGCGFGLERICSLYLNINNVLLTSLFPRTPKHLN